MFGVTVIQTCEGLVSSSNKYILTLTQSAALLYSYVKIWKPLKKITYSSNVLLLISSDAYKL